MVRLVGILNLTPDSFSDGGQYQSPDAAVRHAQQLFADGATWVDVGAESTRPGATGVTLQEELLRLSSVVSVLVQAFPGRISLDTRHPQVAEWFLDLGGTILNDVSGFGDSQMQQLAPRFDFVIVNHFPGGTVGEVHAQAIDDIRQVRDALLARRQLLLDRGMGEEQVILDPGIGFGKTNRLNTELLGFAALVPGIPVLVGHSRKRFLGERRMELLPNVEAAERAVAAGTQYLRVHDVAGHAMAFGVE